VRRQDIRHNQGRSAQWGRMRDGGRPGSAPCPASPRGRCRSGPLGVDGGARHYTPFRTPLQRNLVRPQPMPRRSDGLNRRGAPDAGSPRAPAMAGNVRGSFGPNVPNSATGGGHFPESSRPPCRIRASSCSLPGGRPGPEVRRIPGRRGGAGPAHPSDPTPASWANPWMRPRRPGGTSRAQYQSLRRGLRRSHRRGTRTSTRTTPSTVPRCRGTFRRTAHLDDEDAQRQVTTSRPCDLLQKSAARYGGGMVGGGVVANM
jgi:hypothetical protein